VTEEEKKTSGGRECARCIDWLADVCSTLGEAIGLAKGEKLEDANRKLDDAMDGLLDLEKAKCIVPEVFNAVRLHISDARVAKTWIDKARSASMASALLAYEGGRDVSDLCQKIRKAYGKYV